MRRLDRGVNGLKRKIVAEADRVDTRLERPNGGLLGPGGAATPRISIASLTMTPSKPSSLAEQPDGLLIVAGASTDPARRCAPS